VEATSQIVPQTDEDGEETGRSFEVWENGFGVMLDVTEGFTETHLIQVKAYDRAGNEAESEPVRIFIQRKIEKPEEEPVAEDNATGLLPDLGPPRREAT